MQRERLSERILIERIGARLAKGGCRDCVPRVLGPVKPTAGGANWQVVDHPPCTDPCQAAMLEACSALAADYDVDRPPGRGATD